MIKEMFQLPFQCAKLKCGIIWAFVVISALGPQRGCHLGSAVSRVVGLPCRLQLSLVLGGFCAVGLCSRALHGLKI